MMWNQKKRKDPNICCPVDSNIPGTSLLSSNVFQSIIVYWDVLLAKYTDDRNAHVLLINSNVLQRILTGNVLLVNDKS